MNNLILVTGIYQKLESGQFQYKVDIWAERPNENLSFITALYSPFDSYTELMKLVKSLVSKYFNDDSFLDGAKTIYNERIF